MKKKNIAFLFFIFAALLFLVNLAIIIFFSRTTMEDSFYNSLNVASLSISFSSFVASSFFSLSVYLQSKEQRKINESLPKKDDQYIIANYSLFNIEKEISFFSIDDVEKDILIKGNKYFIEKDKVAKEISRLVFLPTDSMNIPTYKVLVKSIGFYSALNQELYFASVNTGIDGDYSSNVLQREYNCICVDLAENYDKITDIFSKTQYIELSLDIISVFNVKMGTKFSIRLDKEKNIDSNPDKTTLKDLKTYTIHHCNYIIEEKSILC